MQKLLPVNCKNNIMIAGHCGNIGGNIAPNTTASYDAAFYQGAKIIEMDVARSKDGNYHMFHTDKEALLLHKRKPFGTYTSKEISKFSVYNTMGNKTKYSPEKLEDILAHFRGKDCYLNLDRSWDYWEDLLPHISDMGMTDQILLKCEPNASLLETLEKYGPDFPYMMIINHRNMHMLEDIKQYGVNYVGAELIIKTPDSPILTENVIQRLHSENKICWGNAIQWSPNTNLSVWHNDEISITGRPDDGWGWFVEQGFDIIQTDWVKALHEYLKSL